jgi:hypothetical protein
MESGKREILLHGRVAAILLVTPLQGEGSNELQGNGTSVAHGAAMILVALLRPIAKVHCHVVFRHFKFNVEASAGIESVPYVYEVREAHKTQA